MPAATVDALIPGELDPAALYTVTLADGTQIFVADELEILAIFTSTEREGINPGRLTEPIRVGDPVHHVSLERGVADIPVTALTVEPLITSIGKRSESWKAASRELPAAARWELETETGSVHVLTPDANGGWLYRRKRIESEQLRRDDEAMPAVLRLPLVASFCAELVLGLRDDGIPTVRRTGPVTQIRRYL